MNVETITFIPSMECLPVADVPDGPLWTYEIKLDGFRLEALCTSSGVTIYSRRETDLSERFPYVANALRDVPPGTVLDGELVALGPDGRPSFNMLQSFRSAEQHILYYAFDILVHKGRSLLDAPLSERRDILRSVIQKKKHVDLSAVVDASAADMIKFVSDRGLEGVVAKRADSAYEPGKRTGAWSKHRMSQGQEFVVGGYVPGHLGLDSVIVGFYRGSDLIYSARVRAGFTPASRREVFGKIKHLASPVCPFVNLPETADGRWGQGLTAEKMKQCVWLKPEAVARIEFLEWSSPEHLRHTKFAGLRDDKDARAVVKET